MVSIDALLVSYKVENIAGIDFGRGSVNFVLDMPLSEVINMSRTNESS